MKEGVVFLKERLLYEEPRLEIHNLESTDVVTLSEGEQGDPNKMEFEELGL